MIRIGSAINNPAAGPHAPVSASPAAGTSLPVAQTGSLRRRVVNATSPPQRADLEQGVARSSGIDAADRPRSHARSIFDVLAADRNEVPTVTTFMPGFGLAAPLDGLLASLGRTRSTLSINREHAGPVGGVTLLDWSIPDPADFRLVPPTSHQAEASAREELDSVRRALAPLLQAEPAERRRPGALSAMGRAVADALAALPRRFGIQRPEAVTLQDIVALYDEAAGGTVPPRFEPLRDLLAAVNRGTARLQAATYMTARADRGMAFIVACLEAGSLAGRSPGDDDASNRLDRHVAAARASAPGPAPEGLPETIPANLRACLTDMSTLRSRAAGESAAARAAIADAKGRLDDIRKARLVDLADRRNGWPPIAPDLPDLVPLVVRLPGAAIGGVDDAGPAAPAPPEPPIASLDDALQALRRRLLDRIRPDDLKAVPADDVMHLVQQAAWSVFGHRLDIRYATAEALGVLARTRAEHLPALVDGDARSAPALLAIALGRLPRGAELLSRLCATSNFLIPGGADGKRLAQQRKLALRYFSVASATLAQADAQAMSPASRTHLGLARQAALGMLGTDGASIHSLPDAQRFAFRAVRNRFHAVGPGTALDKADQLLRRVSGDMLTSPARSSTLARFNPLGDPTPLNPAALSSAGTALKQAGLIGESFQDIAELRRLVDTLAMPGDGAAAVAVTALRQTLQAVLDAVGNEPQNIGRLTADDDRAIPERFGMSPDQLTGNPAVRQLWQRWSRRNEAETLANAVGGWLKLGDTESQQITERGQVPDRFGLSPDALARDAAVDELWHKLTVENTAATIGRLARLVHDRLVDASRATPCELLRDLGRTVRQQLVDADSPDMAKAVQTVVARLDRARATGIWEDARLDTPEQLLDAIVAVFRVMRLRSRLVFQGDTTAALDTSKLTTTLGAGAESWSTVLRPNFAVRHQTGANLEIGFSTAAFYVVAGWLTSNAGRAGAAAGAGTAWLTTAEHGAGVGARVVEAGAAGSFERMDQDGIRLNVPRDRSTEERNLRECEDTLRQLVLWERFRYKGPVQAILTQVDVASINLMDRNERSSTRLEAQLGSAPLQVDIGPVRPRLGGTVRTAADERKWRQTESTGYYTIEDARLDLAAQQAANWGLQTTLQLVAGKSGGGQTVSLSASDALTMTREGQLPFVNYATLRVVTTDGEISTAASRFTTTTSDLASYQAFMRANRAQWIAIASRYTAFPPGFDDAMKMAASERDFDDWMAVQAPLHNNFAEYSPLMSLHDDMGGALDAIDAERELLRTAPAGADGVTQQLQDLLATRYFLFNDIGNWVLRRSSNNLGLSHADVPGIDLAGLLWNAGGRALMIANRGLFPPQGLGK